jgi:hypothetical protein
MAEAVDDLPEAAGRRFADGAFTSGLTVPDFAACLQMGLEPVGYVQGFCVMKWGYQGYELRAGWRPKGSDYSETWRCPHGMVSMEHRMWGQNCEQPWVARSWGRGFASAYGRMVEEARSLGAHGIVGVVDTTAPLSDLGVLEFRIQGTAVRVADGPAPIGKRVWTTYLAGQRLAKLVEAGFAPISVAAAMASVRVWAYCVTSYLTEGSNSPWGNQSPGAEIEQTAKAHMAVRRLAREHVRSQLGEDSLHGASLKTSTRELGEGDTELQCILRGNRVRRFKSFDPLPVPRPTVRLS